MTRGRPKLAKKKRLRSPKQVAKKREFQRFRASVLKSKRILISTHQLPDGDGLGAQVALFHYLKGAKKSCRILNPDPAPQRYQFLDPNDKILRSANADLAWKEFDLWVIVDTNDPRRLGSLWPELSVRAKEVVFLDHHPETVVGPERRSISLPVHASVISDTQASSIGEMLNHLFEDLNLCPWDPKIAQGLYVSVMTDTNSFRYARTTPDAHDIAGKCIALGVNPEEVYQQIYSSKQLRHLQLLGGMLQNAKTSSDGRLAWLEVDLESRKRHQASADDTASFLNLLLLLQDAEVVCLFREEDDQRIRVSIKSKGKVIVNQVAMELGGGGHHYAAGLAVKGSLPRTVSIVTQRLIDTIRHSNDPSN